MRANPTAVCGARKQLGALLGVILICGCGSATASTGASGTAAPIPAPMISTSAAQNGAIIVTLSDSSPSSTILYTVDGSVPTSTSQTYEAPFLIATSLTVKAVVVVQAGTSSVTSQSFQVSVPSGSLVWSDEFDNNSGAPAAPNPNVWTYDTGSSGFGNHELENYCAWGSATPPCSNANPNAYVGTDGYLHIVAQQPTAGIYTSARLKTQGLFSFQYGRFEVRAQVPEAQGFWPAAWLLGNNVTTVEWPACGEQDVLERVNAAKSPDWNEGSVHGVGFTGNVGLGTVFNFPTGQTASGWHTYGMIWNEGSVAYYVDDPTHPYVKYSTSSLKSLKGSIWPFDSGQSNFILLNLAIGGDWPGAPDPTTPFPSQMLIDYVRVYAN